MAHHAFAMDLASRPTAYFPGSTLLSSRSSYWMGVVAYGLPQMEERPAAGLVFPSNETIA